MVCITTIYILFPERFIKRTVHRLGMNTDHNLSRKIECKSTEFHFKLLDAVLAGFVDMTPAVLKALEGILQSLSKTVEQSSSNADTKSIVCERYEYIPQADLIKSCMAPK